MFRPASASPASSSSNAPSRTSDATRLHHLSMTLLLARTCAGIFVLLGAWHFHWALGGRLGLHAAVPQVLGRPAFRPRRWVTAAVGSALLACAALLLGLGGGA